VIALVAMAVGSISFGIKMYNDNSSKELDEKIQTAQSTLEYYFRYIDNLDDTDAERLAAELNQLSKNVHIDINIYNAKGLLVHTSQGEIFEKHLMGRRMNGAAFEAMDQMKLLKFSHQEHIGSLRFQSVYAPLFNDKGKLLAYLNLPYFSRPSNITGDISSVVATVLNIYILLLVATLLAGTAISNQLSRPLVEVGNKMRRLDLTKQLEHINYHGDDELGGLIHAYNEMVDEVVAASQRMAQMEREQAWREMARQIAHEIKNPLTPMRLSLQHLMRLKKENVPDWPDRFDGLAKTLIEQIDILSDAASELSSFSRFYREEMAPVEVNRLIQEQCTLFTTGEAVKLYFISEVDPATVLGRKQQLSRVLVNLISNAKQALEGKTNGQIRIRLEQIDAQYALHIEDNGSGVPEKLRVRLFTPNFTTKSGGTGLGLAICRSIIEQTQGTISYAASEWGGACFTIHLPVYVPDLTG
jgi:signal transduction histidine kinase